MTLYRITETTPEGAEAPFAIATTLEDALEVFREIDAGNVYELGRNVVWIVARK